MTENKTGAVRCGFRKKRQTEQNEKRGGGNA